MTKLHRMCLVSYSVVVNGTFESRTPAERFPAFGCVRTSERSNCSNYIPVWKNLQYYIGSTYQDSGTLQDLLSTSGT